MRSIAKSLADNRQQIYWETNDTDEMGDITTPNFDSKLGVSLFVGIRDDQRFCFRVFESVGRTDSRQREDSDEQNNC